MYADLITGKVHKMKSSRGTLNKLGPFSSVAGRDHKHKRKRCTSGNTVSAHCIRCTTASVRYFHTFVFDMMKQRGQGRPKAHIYRPLQFDPSSWGSSPPLFKNHEPPHFIHTVPHFVTTPLFTFFPRGKSGKVISPQPPRTKALAVTSIRKVFPRDKSDGQKGVLPWTQWGAV